ncbi:hypothetical protein SNEBB_010424, partial [Seison nebaliae]
MQMDKMPPMKIDDVDPGDPLFLTPYIESGKTEEGRQKSRITEWAYKGKSHSGFITVDKKCNSNIFFMFFHSQKGNESSPLLVWLQGGPGASSLFGLFIEHGPVLIDENIELKERATTWNENYHLLYIDNPVGTGFSFTLNRKCLAKDETDVANNLYEFMKQFYILFPD